MSTSPEFQIEPFDPSRHRRDEFKCESAPLTEFLHKRARKEMDAKVSACFVLVPVSDPGRISGFYTLSAAEITTTDLPEQFKKRLPNYQRMPATLLGRLARDSSFKGQGIGDRLMYDALARTLAGSREIGSLAVITDPKDDKAAAFYQDFGFQVLTGKRMFLTMKDVAAFLKE